MSEELTKPIEITSPITGEVLTLDHPTADLGHLLADIREYESLIREAKGAVSGELLRRMDQGASWTFRGNGLELRAPSPAPEEQYDGQVLREALLPFVDKGELSIEAVDAAVQTIVVYKPQKRGINALRKLGGKVADTIDTCRTDVPKTRYISVTRA